MIFCWTTNDYLYILIKPPRYSWNQQTSPEKSTSRASFNPNVSFNFMNDLLAGESRKTTAKIIHEIEYKGILIEKFS